MKSIFLISIFTLVFQLGNAQSLTWAWSSDTSMRNPAAVLYDPVDNCLWVSCIHGNPNEVDSLGNIWQLRIKDGRIIDREWMVKMNSPKGLARYKKEMFVADITDLVIIDIYGRTYTQRIRIPGAVALNDVSVGPDGTVYVSDTKTRKIYQWKEGKLDTYLENLVGPSGLLAVGDALFILDGGSLLKYEAGNLKTIAKGMDKSTEGIEMSKPGEFIVSCLDGLIYHVTDQGKVKIMTDSRKRKSTFGDLGFDPSTNTVFVPTYQKNYVMAYQLK